MEKSGSCVEAEAEPAGTLGGLAGGTPLAGSAAAISVANLMGPVMVRRTGVAGEDFGHRPGQPRSFIGQRQQGFTFRAGKSPARMFAQEKEDKGKNQTKADRKGEGNDGHRIEGNGKLPVSVLN